MGSPLLNQLLKHKNDKRTWIILGSIIAFILLLLAFMIASKHKNSLSNKHINESSKAAKIEPFQKIAEFSENATGEAIGSLQASETQTSSQLSDIEKQNKKLTAQVQSMSQTLSAIQSGKVAVTDQKNSNQTSASPVVKNLNVQNTIPSPQVVNLSNQQMAAEQSNNLNALGNPAISRRPIRMPGAGISDFSFEYEGGSSANTSTQKCTPDNCVLPGTFARAVLLGAADANASVNGQSNTTPILFRILGRGVLPNGYHSHLKGCFVVGEVYGDISSERGEVKLAQISCVIHGKTVSKSINGTAYFLGKEGIRGTAIMRNGPLLWNAGIAGMLSGLAQGVQQAQQTQSISPLGTTTTVPSDRIATSMAAGGVQSAANTLANYYVKRADQYHPIIELNAGTIVNLVFLNQFLLKPNGKQSSGSLVTKSPSNAYWQSNNNQSNQANQNGNLANYSYRQSVSNSQVNAVQNQINQINQ